MEKLLIIDGNSIINRAFYALPLLSNSKGEYSNALYGFVNILTKAIVDLKPKYIAIAFDYSKKTFRNNLYSEYKATRKNMPEELAAQFPILKEMLKTMSIKYFEKENFEADDIIGTLAKIENVEKIILSGDRDLFQLIDNNTKIWFPKKGVSDISIIDINELKQQMNLTPSQIIDYKSLRGDSSDNIPGVPGIGEKGAMDLISCFGNLENLYMNIDNIKGKLKEKLIYGKDLAFISKKLATINRNVPIEINLNDLQYPFPYSKETYNFFKNYEFNSIIKRSEIFNSFIYSNEEKKSNSYETIIINSAEELNKIISFINEENRIALELGNEFKFSCSPNVLYTFKQTTNLFESYISAEEAIVNLKHIFENKNIKKICYDSKTIKHKLKKYNISMKGEVFDINIAKYLLGDSLKEEKFEPPFYFFIEKELSSRLSSNDLINLYNKVEMPLVEVLFNMEENGLKIDSKKLNEIKTEFELELKLITQKIKLFANEDFNINSPKQLSYILFEKLGLKAKNNKKNSTSVDILEEIESQHPIISEILKYRKIQKILSSYIEPFYIISKKNNDYIKTIFNQTLTSTGRLSSSEPNLQNLPVRDEEGKKLRKIFISRFNDGQIISADYNQIELRLMAHFSQDPTLIDAFNRKEDIHAKTASMIFNIPIKDVDSNQRRLAKTVNFGIIYGISEYGLSLNLKTSVKQAKNYMTSYFNIFPKIKEYMEKSIEIAKENGYAKTIFGRKRFIPELSSKNIATRKFGERVAINMPLQGTASDIIKLAMINVQNKIDENQLKCKIILQIHDELVIDCPKSEISEVKKILINEMENSVKLSVDLPVEVAIGENLYECK